MNPIVKYIYNIIKNNLKEIDDISFLSCEEYKHFKSLDKKVYFLVKKDNIEFRIAVNIYKNNIYNRQDIPNITTINITTINLKSSRSYLFKSDITEKKLRLNKIQLLKKIFI